MPSIDPSQTALLRRAFAADMHKRFEALRRKVWQLIVVHGAFGIDGDGVIVNAGVWAFLTNIKKLAAFQKWLKGQVDKGILQAVSATGEPISGKPWTAPYIQSAYKKGLIRSYLDVHKVELSKPAGFVEGSKAQFLEQAFNAPERTSKLKLLYTRSYEDLKGVTSAMSTQLSRELATGMVNGDHPLETAKRMTAVIKGMDKKRAKLIALTETIHAHAEGQLDGMEDLGVGEVGADVEISTADDNIVCPICKGLIGKVFTIKEARGVIPLHPRCRCSWRPVMKVPSASDLKKMGAKLKFRKKKSG